MIVLFSVSLALSPDFFSTASLTCIKASPTHFFSATPSLLLKHLRPCKPSRPALSCHASLQPSLLGPCHRMPLQMLLLQQQQLMLQLPQPLMLLPHHLLPMLLLLRLLTLLQHLLLMLQHPLLMPQLLLLLQNNFGIILLLDEY